VFVFFWCLLYLGLADQDVGVKKGGVLAFIGVHGGLLFLFLFYPGSLRFISPYCYTDRCRRCLALFLSFVVLAFFRLAMFIPRR
jgi:uncharacterized membrane protein required for colicin V production